MTYTVPAGTYGDYSTAFIQAYIDAKIADVVDLAPETLNSLNELAAAINDDPAFYATVAAQVAELNTDVTDAVAALGVAENDTNFGTFTASTLPDGVTLKAVLEAFASAYETAKGNLESADSALSGRLDVLEADPTTAAAVAAVQADVDVGQPGVHALGEEGLVRQALTVGDHAAVQALLPGVGQGGEEQLAQAGLAPRQDDAVVVELGELVDEPPHLGQVQLHAGGRVAAEAAALEAAAGELEVAEVRHLRSPLWSHGGSRSA